MALEDVLPVRRGSPGLESPTAKTCEKRCSESQLHLYATPHLRWGPRRHLYCAPHLRWEGFWARGSFRRADRRCLALQEERVANPAASAFQSPARHLSSGLGACLLGSASGLVQWPPWVLQFSSRVAGVAVAGAGLWQTSRKAGPLRLPPVLSQQNSLRGKMEGNGSPERESLPGNSLSPGGWACVRDGALCRWDTDWPACPRCGPAVPPSAQSHEGGAAGLLDPQARLREARQDERGQQVVPAASRLGRCGLCVRPWWPASPKIMESELGPQMWG